MSEPSEHRTETRIEGAMRNHGRSSEDVKTPAALEGEKRKMQRRLEQLQTTMGENGAAPITAKVAPAPTGMQRVKGHSTGRMVFFSGSSFLIGAAVMWLAMKDPQTATPLRPDSQPTMTSKRPGLSASEPTSTSATAARPAIQSAFNQEQEARALLERWRQAWANRDADTYLSFYETTYAPKGQSPSQWAAARRAKLAGLSEISIQIRDIQVSHVNDQRMRVNFLQDYSTGAYQEVARAKSLQLQHGPKGWLIVSEQQAARNKRP
jgi:hypothetical protein